MPNYNFNNNLYQKYISLLKSLKIKLQPIFSKYLDQNELNIRGIESNFKQEIKDIIHSDNIILVSRSSIKKKLKDIGFDPRNLIISGGPLFSEDYLKINPNISDNVIIGIKKKCEHLINHLKNRNWVQKDLVFLYEKDNLTDNIIIEELPKISKLIGKQIKTYVLNSWKDLNLLH